MSAAKVFHVDDLRVQVYNSEAQMAQSVAAIVQEYVQNLLQQQEGVTIVLATGNSQIRFLDALTTLGAVDWSRITCFHLDEYLGIAADHSASFRYYLQERVEKHVQPKQFYYIEGDTLQPLTECDRYSQLLQAQPIDLCFLGIGENGHLAFNEPSVADFHDPYMVKLVKLDPLNRQQQVNTGYFSNFSTVPQYAFTVTIPLISSAKKIICLAPTKRKAKVVKQMLEGEITTNCPASILRQQPQATLFLDMESASLMDNS
ncbi:MAG: glucosamine-6-phosphate deaminase [Nostocaceae cyanobacterium]|nr:glucosamine-6-phosphate deaminase [Nostocaceae cyanobacterium]